MSEIDGQLRSGTPLSERELFQLCLQHIGGLKGALRGLAASRKDIRWLVPVRLLDRMEDHVKKLIVRGGSRVLWLPEMPEWRQ